MARRARITGPIVEPKPLYAQIRDLMVRRIGDGSWRPGMLLPSEFQLAAEFNVSQGTVRKALDELAAQNIVIRRQGRGTFIATHTEERALNHFFHLVGDDGSRRLPESRLVDFGHGVAEPRERARLGLIEGARVLRVERLRILGDRPTICETIAVPVALIPELAKAPVSDLPSTLHELYQARSNTLYDLYHARYGIVIVRAIEHVRAVAATAVEAERLAVALGTPLLEIDRIALDVRGRPVEWRLSRAVTQEHHYLSEIE